MSLVIWQVGGIATAVMYGIAQRAYDEWQWWRTARHYLPQPIANTTPPTTTELNAPTWMGEP